MVLVSALLAACSAPASVGGGAFCSEAGPVSPYLGGVAEAGVSNEGLHTDLDLSIGAVVQPGRTRCAPSAPRSEF